MGRQSQYQNQFLATADTTRTPSAGLWHQVDVDMERRGVWLEQWEDFDALPAVDSLPTTLADHGPIQVFSVSGGSFSAVDVEGGVRNLIEATSDESIVIASLDEPFRMTQDDGELVFEARVQRADITAASGFFVGLKDSTVPSLTVPIAADGTLAHNDIVGFANLEGDPDVFDTMYSTSNGDVVLQADATTLVNNTWIKVGMTFNRGGDNKLRYYINGAELSSSYQVTDTAGDPFPNDARFGWCLGGLGGAGGVDAQVDWVRVAQRSIDET